MWFMTSVNKRRRAADGEGQQRENSASRCFGSGVHTLESQLPCRGHCRSCQGSSSPGVVCKTRLSSQPTRFNFPPDRLEHTALCHFLPQPYKRLTTVLRSSAWPLYDAASPSQISPNIEYQPASHCSITGSPVCSTCE